MPAALLIAALIAANHTPGTIEVARADWSAFAPLQTADLAIPNGHMIMRVERMVRGQCRPLQQANWKFNFDINYAVMLDPQGHATRIIVEDIGCRPIETYVGNVVASLVEQGYVLTAPPAQPQWFTSRINFNLD